MYACLKQLIKMIQLFSLTDKVMRRNEEKREGEINPSESGKSKVNTLETANPKCSKSRPEMEKEQPQNGVSPG